MPERAPHEGERIPAPQPRVRIEPKYPPGARAARTAGHIAVRYTVSGTGKVQSVEIVTSDPPGVFDTTVVDALSRWRFASLVRDGSYVTHRPVLVHLFFYAGRCPNPPRTRGPAEVLRICVDH